MLDCEVYNLAAHALLNPNTENLARIFEQRMHRFEELKQEKQISPGSAPPQQEIKDKPKPKRPPRRGPNWVTGWR
jgi:hypothetical protein